MGANRPVAPDQRFQREEGGSFVVQADGTQTALGLGGYLDIGLLDTMEDLFVNFIGALTFSIIGYFYVCSRGENKFARRFIPVANNSTRPKDASSEAPEKSEIE